MLRKISIQRMISGILIAAGVLCLLYFMILMSRSVDFCIIWLPVSLLFLGMGGYIRYRMCNPTGWRLPGWMVSVFLMFLAILAAWFVVVETKIVRQMYTVPQKDLSYIIVLGSQVKKDQPSLALSKRLDAAAQYLLENPKTKAVLSGGKGDGEEISEALCMYRYLIERGVEEERLLMEDASTTTYENLKFSEELIDRDLKSQKGTAFEKNIGILSNNFHVYRALLLAEKMGYTDVSGIAAASDWRLQLHYLVREFFALIKERMKGNI